MREGVGEGEEKGEGGEGREERESGGEERENKVDHMESEVGCSSIRLPLCGPLSHPLPPRQISIHTLQKLQNYN